MDLLKKVKDALPVFLIKKVYVKDQSDLGKVYNINIHHFGNPTDGYVNIGTDKGIKMFKTLLIRLYHTVLYKDPNWHYFIEGEYNHLRFSNKFWVEIEEILELHKVNYEDPQLWVDEQGITKKYQDVFQKMFHSFSLLAVQEYDEDDIELLLDRVIHCFMNHQTIFLPEHCKKFGNSMEPSMVANYAVGRANYIGRIEEHNNIAEVYNDNLAEYRKEMDKTIDNLTEKYEEFLKSEEVNK
jgi:hypothetical protein